MAQRKWGFWCLVCSFVCFSHTFKKVSKDIQLDSCTCNFWCIYHALGWLSWSYYSQVYFLNSSLLALVTLEGCLEIEWFHGYTFVEMWCSNDASESSCLKYVCGLLSSEGDYHQSIINLALRILTCRTPHPLCHPWTPSVCLPWPSLPIYHSLRKADMR